MHHFIKFMHQNASSCPMSQKKSTLSKSYHGYHGHIMTPYRTFSDLFVAPDDQPVAAHQHLGVVWGKGEGSSQGRRAYLMATHIQVSRF